MAYELIDYGFSEKLESLPRRQARSKYNALMETRAERLDQLRGLVGSGLGPLTSVQAGHVGLAHLDRWLASADIRYSVGEGLDALWHSVAVDTAIFIGELEIMEFPNLRWDFHTRSPKDVGYHEAVLVGHRPDSPGGLQAIVDRIQGSFVNTANMATKFDYREEVMGLADYYERAVSSVRRVSRGPSVVPSGGVNAPAEVVRAFFELMQARDWSGAGELLSPTIRIEYTETGERFEGTNFLEMNRAYPEGWAIAVVETVSEGDRVAAQVRVQHGDDTFWCAGFYRVVDGVIESGVEHWVTEQSATPPAWRRPFSS